MFYLLFFITGFLLGGIVSHYSAYLINTNPDCTEPVQHKLFSKRYIFISIINACLWECLYIFCAFNIITLIYMLIASILLTLSIIDLAVYEIPPQFNVALAMLGAVIICLDIENWLTHVIGAFTVSGFFLILAFATKGKGMGGGDIKLMFSCGLILGWEKIIGVMLIGSVLGSVIHLTLMKVSKKEKVLAFGPYLSAGVYLMLCFGNQIVDWYVTNFLTFNM